MRPLITPSEAKPVRVHPETHVTFLDHLRGLAIFLVFLEHSGMRAYGPEFRLRSPVDAHSFFFDTAFYVPLIGSVGVAIFFVVSGFCIHLSHIKSGEIGFKTFFFRRFFRLYPAYLIALLLTAFIIPPFIPLWATFGPAANLTTHLLLIHNFFPQFVYGIDGPCWTIGVEVQLYLLYPLLLALVRRLGWRNGLLLVLAVEVLFVNSPSILFHLKSLGANNYHYFMFTPFYYWFSWSIGAKIADDWIANKPIFLSRFPLWIWPLIFVAAGMNPILARFEFTFAALSTATIIAFLLSRPAVTSSLQRIPLVDHFRKVGLISYSAYLFHEPVLGLFLNLHRHLITFATPHYAMFLYYLFVWPFVLLAAWVSYRFVERPGIAFGKRLMQRARPDNLTRTS